MQSEQHHDVTMANEEKLRSGVVFAWGLSMFISVLVTIGILSGYFWSKRDTKVGEVVGNVPAFGKTRQELDTVVEGRLNGYKKLSETRFQIPIDVAMKKVVEEGL